MAESGGHAYLARAAMDIDGSEAAVAPPLLAGVSVIGVYSLTESQVMTEPLYTAVPKNKILCERRRQRCETRRNRSSKRAKIESRIRAAG